jgi:hypothetical protein
MQIPAGTRSGFAFYAFSPAKDFEVVSVDAKTGQTRWRAAASPSTVATGVAMNVVVPTGGRSVVCMQPGASYSEGEVSLVSSDEATGRVVWSFGNGTLLLSTPPSSCQSGRSVCFDGRPGLGQPSEHFTVDASSGSVRSEVPLKGADFFREVGDGLRDDGQGHLVAVDANGKVLWARSFSQVFDGEDVGLTAYDFTKQGTTYLGSLGYANYQVQTSGTVNTLDLANSGATAEFDVRTGRTLWVRPRYSIDCGPFVFSIDHPAMCRFTGVKTWHTGDALATFKDFGLTLEGFDLKTGRKTWSWTTKDPDFFDTGKVVRIDDTHYAVTLDHTNVVIDLSAGARRANISELSGWCDAGAVVTPRADHMIDVYQGYGYASEGWSPCQAGKGALDVAPNAPSFAGDVVDGVLAWVDPNGLVKASRIPGATS